ncbi:MAG: response regulator [Magnetococcales bacterium]|nr:response regulator [Magnetococcales bacterium]
MDASKQNPKILLVDNEVNSILPLSCEMENDYDISVVSNYKDALEKAASAPPDLILLDITLPEMDGFAVCKQLKLIDVTKDIPVIIISREDNVDNEIIGFELGAVDYFIKPIHPLKLKHRVNTHIVHRLQKLALQKSNDHLSDVVGDLENNNAQLITQSSDLKGKEAHLRSILDNALDAIITVDENNIIEEFNPAAQDLFGYTRDAVLGKDVTTLFVLPDINSYQNKKGLQYLSADGDWVDDSRIIKKRFKLSGVRSDNKIVDLEVGMVETTRDQKRHVTVFLQDITDHKQLIKSLSETLEIAEESNKAKSEFLANMGHEIRSPMNAIMGMVELVLASKITSDQRENLEIAQNSSINLMGLINDLMDFSKIEAGRLKIESIPFELRKQIENCCESLAIACYKKNLEMYCDIAPRIPAVIGDPLRLNQVLINLVNNAIKFTDQGEIVVRVEILPNIDVDGKNVSLHFWVADTGIGISQDRLTVIFKRFTQLDSSIKRKYGGSGLGLTISRHLVKMMNGNIWVNSEVGKGTVFHFTASFPVANSAAIESKHHLEKHSTQMESTHLSGVNILIADANETGRKIVKDMLNRFGANVTDVNSVSQLIAALQNSKNDYPNVVILDKAMLLPELIDAEDLFETNKIIAMLPPHVKARELVANTNYQDIATIKKPVKLYSLLNKIDKIINLTPLKISENIPLSIPHNKNITPLRILLVEDLINNQKLAISTLEKVGHTVICAENGYKALKALAVDKYDLILMDVHMPEMDGYEASRHIRDGKVKNCDPQIPIVAITARDIQTEVDVYLASGMNGYLRKPYRAAELLGVIELFTAT